jgi:fructokinase
LYGLNPHKTLLFNIRGIFMRDLFGGIEAGGTKFVCMVGLGPGQVEAEIRFPTTSPNETIQRALDFLSPYARQERLAAVGIGSFGPVDLNPASETYGYITSTPKEGWAYTNLFGKVRQALDVPVAFDTDVNAAAFGEQYWARENHDLDPFLYMTVGTGIGVGVLVNGRPVHGLIHPEVGHQFIPHDRSADPFEGVCPYHGDCLEGLASGPSIARRWGQPAELLPPGHPAWDLEANYIALALVNLVASFSPRRIVLGGGVFQQPGLCATVRTKVQQRMNGYYRSSMILETIDQYIVLPTLDNRSGVLGAIALAMRNIN